MLHKKQIHYFMVYILNSTSHTMHVLINIYQFSLWFLFYLMLTIIVVKQTKGRKLSIRFNNYFKEVGCTGRLCQIWTNDTFILTYTVLINQSINKENNLRCALRNYYYFLYTKFNKHNKMLLTIRGSNPGPFDIQSIYYSTTLPLHLFNLVYFITQ